MVSPPSRPGAREDRTTPTRRGPPTARGGMARLGGEGARAEADELRGAGECPDTPPTPQGQTMHTPPEKAMQGRLLGDVPARRRDALAFRHRRPERLGGLRLLQHGCPQPAALVGKRAQRCRRPATSWRPCASSTPLPGCQASASCSSVPSAEARRRRHDRDAALRRRDGRPHDVAAIERNGGIAARVTIC